jgi:SAM-dependent methyltransferase
MQPLSTTETRSRAFYDSIAADYDRLLDKPEIHAIRKCFWLCVETALPHPSRVLDFGAGSGIDAEHLASLGHEVTAYDLSEGMLSVLRSRCAAQVAAGTIVPIGGTLDEVRQALAERGPFDGILCNFGVFSMIPRLRPVFRLFGELLRPGGIALVSVQNPWYPGDLRTRGFWTALLAMPITGVMRYRSAQLGCTFRHTPAQIRRAARPEFIVDQASECCRTRFRWRDPFCLVVLRRV